MKPCILVVDDDERYVELLEFNLSEQGYRIFVATRSEDALNIARRERPDVALLDVMMPEMDGFALARAMRELPETRHVPIIFLSAKGQGVDRANGFEAGAIDYLVKPFQHTELVERIERVLALRKGTETIHE